MIKSAPSQRAFYNISICSLWKLQILNSPINFHGFLHKEKKIINRLNVVSKKELYGIINKKTLNFPTMIIYI